MSENKPPIYAHCPAECKWETVHRSEFEASATYASVNHDADGIYRVDPMHMYKIKTTNNGTAYNCALSLYCSDGENTFTYNFGTFDEFDILRDYIYFEILYKDDINVVYEVNGNRYSISFSKTDDSEYVDFTNAVLIIENAVEVFIHNTNAEILVKSAYMSAQSGGYTDTEQNFYNDLAAIQGLASELEALL